MALLPFLVLVKVAVFLYTREGYSTVLALACGTACTAAIVTAYAALVWHHFTGRVRLALVARRFALPLVVAYCAYALIYLSTANAKWLWGLTHIGDPVIVKGTPRPLDWGNGWTDWNKTWDQYVKGSAIPVS